MSEKTQGALGAWATKLLLEEVRERTRDLEGEAVEFLRELIRIRSFSGDEGRVVQAIERRMRDVGYDEVRIDGFGNVLGRIGSGPRVVAFDAHVDTVGVGDPRLWKVDPFAAELQDGVIYGRGASDQKGGMAALVYAGAVMKALGLEDRVTAWIVGSVFEEDCDGLCWHYILSERILAPELVILTEPTELQVYRGHRGRMEIEVTTRGISCHGSAPERGVNAVYRMAPFVAEVEKLGPRLSRDAFLGQGSLTVSEVRSTSPSLCAVADSCTVHIDRRLTEGESDLTALAEIDGLLRRVESGEGPETARAGNAEVVVPEFRRPSHRGLVYPMRQYFPAWALPETHPFVRLALEVKDRLSTGIAEPLPAQAGKWTFSTNGVATMGLHGVPTIGFGPASELHAHSPEDQCPVDHIGKAIAFYAAFAAAVGSTPAEKA